MRESPETGDAQQPFVTRSNLLAQAAHPELSRSHELQVFLEAGEQDWQIEQARTLRQLISAAVIVVIAVLIARIVLRLHVISSSVQSIANTAVHQAALYARNVVLQARLSGGGGAAGGAKKTLVGAVQMIRDLGANAAHSFSGRSEEQGEDPEYLRVRGTVSDVTRHLV